MYLNSFNHFRALAIIFIVAGHSLSLTGIKSQTLIEGMLHNLILGGTSLFVFISGFLFHHVFYPKYNYQKFIKNKITNVFIPYLILGFIPVIVLVLMKSTLYEGYFLPKADGFLYVYIIPAMKYYTTGRFLAAYWYIPFIMLTFLLSPLHIKFIKLNLPLQLLVISTLFLLSILMHRPVANLSVIQSVLYFSPVYLIGITSSIHREKVYQLFKGREFLLLMIAVGLALFQAYHGHVGNYHKPPLNWGGIDLMLIQKVFLFMFLMVWLHKYESVNNKAIHTLASTSFAIFFLHPIILRIFEKMHIELFREGSWIVLVLFVSALTLLCLGLAKLTHKIIPKFSRYLIGY